MNNVTRIMLTTARGFDKKRALFAAKGGTMKASSKDTDAILKNPSLHLERLRAPKMFELFNSAYSPSDPEVVNNTRAALLGELDHVRFYRIMLSRYSILFEFYNSKSKLLSSLQPRQRISFRLRFGDEVYRVRYSWSRLEQRMTTKVKIKKEGERFYHKQPLYVDEFDD